NEKPNTITLGFYYSTFKSRGLSVDLSL
ncbi:hypothetical protein MGSAQ_002889, partial [marine sediment metagenome]